jgi:predicted PurR-regulated permease PerM
MTWARAELVLAVLLAVAAYAYLDRMRKGKSERTWHGLLSAFAVIMLAVVVFLSGVADMRMYV